MLIPGKHFYWVASGDLSLLKDSKVESSPTAAQETLHDFRAAEADPKQNESYHNGGIKRLTAGAAPRECIVGPVGTTKPEESQMAVSHRIGLLHGGVNPRVEEGWLFGKFIEERPQSFQQLLTALELHPDEYVQC
jgi:hypothetical protein